MGTSCMPNALSPELSVLLAGFAAGADWRVHVAVSWSGFRGRLRLLHRPEPAHTASRGPLLLEGILVQGPLQVQQGTLA